MLKVTVEYIPFGDRSKAEVIAEMEIVNNCTGTKESGNYTFTAILRKGLTKITGEVKNFKREKRNCLALVYECLKKIFHK